MDLSLLDTCLSYCCHGNVKSISSTLWKLLLLGAEPEPHVDSSSLLPRGFNAKGLKLLLQVGFKLFKNSSRSQVFPVRLSPSVRKLTHTHTYTIEAGALLLCGHSAKHYSTAPPASNWTDTLEVSHEAFQVADGGVSLLAVGFVFVRFWHEEAFRIWSAAAAAHDDVFNVTWRRVQSGAARGDTRVHRCCSYLILLAAISSQWRKGLSRISRL